MDAAVREKEFLKAKNYAYKLLSYQPRSIKEIENRLLKKGFSPQSIKKCIKYLTELNYLNDEEFAQSWVRNKIQLSPVGWSLLRYQLRQKGVRGEIIDQALDNFTQQYDELNAASNLALAQCRHYHNSLAVQKLKGRLYRYLRRRGFSLETISQAIIQATKSN